MSELVIIAIAFVISLIIMYYIIINAVKNAITKNTYKNESLMRLQHKQMKILAEMAIKNGVSRNVIEDIVSTNY